MAQIKIETKDFINDELSEDIVKKIFTSIYGYYITTENQVFLINRINQLIKDNPFIPGEIILTSLEDGDSSITLKLVNGKNKIFRCSKAFGLI